MQSHILNNDRLYLYNKIITNVQINSEIKFIVKCTVYWDLLAYVLVTYRSAPHILVFKF